MFLYCLGPVEAEFCDTRISHTRIFSCGLCLEFWVLSEQKFYSVTEALKIEIRRVGGEGGGHVPARRNCCTVINL
jgi:hypothetical protein